MLRREIWSRRWFLTPYWSYCGSNVDKLFVFSKLSDDRSSMGCNSAHVDVVPWLLDATWMILWIDPRYIHRYQLKNCFTERCWNAGQHVGKPERWHEQAGCDDCPQRKLCRMFQADCWSGRTVMVREIVLQNSGRRQFPLKEKCMTSVCRWSPHLGRFGIRSTSSARTAPWNWARKTSSSATVSHTARKITTSSSLRCVQRVVVPFWMWGSSWLLVLKATCAWTGWQMFTKRPPEESHTGSVDSTLAHFLTEMHHGDGRHVAPGALRVRVLRRSFRRGGLPRKGRQSVLQVTVFPFLFLWRRHFSPRFAAWCLRSGLWKKISRWLEHPPERATEFCFHLFLSVDHERCHFSQSLVHMVVLTLVSQINPVFRRVWSFKWQLDFLFSREDYFSMFAPKCGGCSRPIMDNYISALNRQWHPECFVCMVRSWTLQQYRFTGNKRTGNIFQHRQVRERM